ncbi:hypothetical protein QCA50_016088 [Cerrena zonata]|uniref:Uncharacterized protein n=1 Tax=Cerrena zonata TaxID=2478898 RepID=A0AAW0FP79_9APHY
MQTITLLSIVTLSVYACAAPISVGSNLGIFQEDPDSLSGIISTAPSSNTDQDYFYGSSTAGAELDPPDGLIQPQASTRRSSSRPRDNRRNPDRFRNIHFGAAGTIGF